MHDQKRRESRKRWYLRNKAQQVALVRANEQRYAARVDALKLKPCLDCGGKFPPVCMDFDHRPGQVKLGNVSSIRTRWSMERVLAEIAKCDLVCANCHRIRTRARGLTEKARAS